MLDFLFPLAYAYELRVFEVYYYIADGHFSIVIYYCFTLQ